MNVWACDHERSHQISVEALASQYPSVFFASGAVFPVISTLMCLGELHVWTSAACWLLFWSEVLISSAQSHVVVSLTGCKSLGNLRSTSHTRRAQGRTSAVWTRGTLTALALIVQTSRTHACPGSIFHVEIEWKVDSFSKYLCACFISDHVRSHFFGIFAETVVLYPFLVFSRAIFSHTLKLHDMHRV